MKLPRPVIFVPGVTATDLRDQYDLPPTILWSVLDKDFDRVALHPEDTRYEARLPAQVRPDQIFSISYKEMVRDLRHNLTSDPREPVPVYLFGYDWRQPLQYSQNELAAFVDEVINKTRLTRHYHADGYDADPRVNLVGHSMGGMVIAGYLSDQGAAAKKKVDRVATLCTPFKGSLEAVEKLIKGTRNQREREAARLTPSLYQLLPSFHDGITIDPALGKDLFDSKVWQSGIAESILTELRVRGSGALPATLANAKKILQNLLDEARTHRAMLEAFNPSDCGLRKEDWLCVIGIGEETRVQLRVTDQTAGPLFDLSESMIRGGKGAADGLNANTGDGTVPYLGALPSFDTTIATFSRNDFGKLELISKSLNVVTALHGIIPNMDRLQDRLRNFLAWPPVKAP